ncbi:hypothetical protein TrVE_jg3832 [Triparma verrucosa]|uniref:G patch domain-containing protein n=1 Tax=Triparma verrucosa TaxID=1606542 RepID=A0A9W7CET7_9STRA|nr:hypothetical protein TrVE_jg3832 [Triparma verrucosa]
MPPPGRAGEVLDAQGRRRFHGAFTGGFSAGYYNTAGSASGWTPSTYNSSHVQTPSDFMDEDDGVLGGSLKVDKNFNSNSLKKSKNDTRGGHVDDELIDIFVSSRIGLRLLEKLNPSKSARKNNPNPTIVPPPKSDTYGLGYSPFKNAPEFLSARTSSRSLPSPSTKISMSSVKTGGERLNSNRLTVYDSYKSTGFSLLGTNGDDVKGGDYNNELIDYNSDSDSVKNDNDDNQFNKALSSYTLPPPPLLSTSDSRPPLKGFIYIKINHNIKRYPGPRVPFSYTENHIFETSEIGGGGLHVRLQSTNNMKGKIEKRGNFKAIKGMISSRFCEGKMLDSNHEVLVEIEEKKMSVFRDTFVPPPILAARLGFRIAKEDKVKWMKEREEGRVKGSESFMNVLGEIANESYKKETPVSKVTSDSSSVPIKLKGSVRPPVDLFKSIFEEGCDESTVESSSDDEIKEEEEIEKFDGEVEEDNFESKPGLVFRSRKRKIKDDSEREDEEEESIKGFDYRKKKSKKTKKEKKKKKKNKKEKKEKKKSHR